MNPYTTLGVNKNATDAEIKAAYRKLVVKHHPDKGGDAEVFSGLAEAWACLSNPEKKAEYDETGVMGTIDLDALIQQEALSIIAKMVSETLDNMVKHNMDRHHGDFVDAMKKFIHNNLEENQAELEKAERAERLYADTLAKMYIKNPDEFEGSDVITVTIKKKREENDFNLFAVGNGLKVLSRCLEFLELYGCHVPLSLGDPDAIRQNLNIDIGRMMGSWPEFRTTKT